MWNSPANCHGRRIASRKTGSWSFLEFRPCESPCDWFLLYKHGDEKWSLGRFCFCKQIMLMNLLATVVLFLFIGPFDYVSSRETKTSGRKALFVWNTRSSTLFLRAGSSVFLPSTKRKLSESHAFDIAFFCLYFVLHFLIHKFAEFGKLLAVIPGI